MVPEVKAHSEIGVPQRLYFGFCYTLDVIVYEELPLNFDYYTLGFVYWHDLLYRIYEVHRADGLYSKMSLLEVDRFASKYAVVLDDAENLAIVQVY